MGNQTVAGGSAHGGVQYGVAARGGRVALAENRNRAAAGRNQQNQ